MMQRLWRDSLIYGVAIVFSRGLPILLVPFYTRILSPADFGALDITTVLAALVALLVPLEIGQGLARHWSEESSAEGRRRLAGTSFWFTAVMFGGFLLLALALSPWLTLQLLSSPHYLHAMQIALVLMVGNGLLFSLQNQLRFELRSREFAQVSLVYGLLFTGLGLLLGGGLGLGLEGVLAGQALGAALACGFAYWLLRDSMAFGVDPGRLRMLLLFSWPLVLSGIGTYLSLYANRLILNAMTSLEVVGLFAVGQRVASIVGLMIVGVQGALTPLIYAHYTESATPATLARIFSGFVGVALLACLGLALFAPELIRLFAPPAYAPAAGLVALLAPAALLSQMYVFAPGIALGKKTGWQLLVFCASAAVCLVLSYLLVPRMGAEGAAWAALASSVVFLWLWFAVSQRWYGVPFQWGRLAVALAGFLALLVAGQTLQALPFWSGLLARAGLLAAMGLVVAGAGLVDVRQLALLVASRLRGAR